MADSSSGACDKWNAVENPKLLFQTYDSSISKWKTLPNGNYGFVSKSEGDSNANSASRGICGSTYGYTDNNYQNYGHFCLTNPPCSPTTYPSTNIEEFYFGLTDDEMKTLAGKNKYLGFFAEFPGYLVHGAAEGMDNDKLASCYSTYNNCKKIGQQGLLGCIRLDASE